MGLEYKVNKISLTEGVVAGLGALGGGVVLGPAGAAAGAILGLGAYSALNGSQSHHYSSNQKYK